MAMIVLHYIQNYRNFGGEIKSIGPQKYTSRGIYEIDEKKNTITITDLPVAVWTENYKTFLENSIVNKSASAKEQKKQFIKSYENNSTNSKIWFKLTIVPDAFKKMIKKGDEGIRKMLKLTSKLIRNKICIYLIKMVRLDNTKQQKKS